MERVNEIRLNAYLRQMFQPPRNVTSVATRKTYVSHQHAKGENPRAEQWEDEMQFSLRSPAIYQQPYGNNEHTYLQISHDAASERKVI